MGSSTSSVLSIQCSLGNSSQASQRVHQKDGVLQASLVVAPEGISAKEATDVVVYGQEVLQLGTVVDVVMLLWVPDFLHIRLVEG